MPVSIRRGQPASFPMPPAYPEPPPAIPLREAVDKELRLKLAERTATMHVVNVLHGSRLGPD